MFEKKGGHFNVNLCTKSEMYITVCKIDSITKLYIGKGLILAIVSGKHLFKIITMKNPHRIYVIPVSVL